MPEINGILSTTPISDAYPMGRLRPQWNPYVYLGGMQQYMLHRAIRVSEGVRALLADLPTHPEILCRWSRLAENGLLQEIVAENEYIDRGCMILPPTPLNSKIAVLKKLGLSTTRVSKSYPKSVAHPPSSKHRVTLSKSKHRLQSHSHSRYCGR